MAHYQEVDYFSEEGKSVTSRPGGFLGHLLGGGSIVEQHVVKEKFEEVDKASRAGGHRGHSFQARESKFEEDINTRTGEFHGRKDNFVVKAN